MNRLMLKPYRSGYGFALSTGVISTQTQAGMPRQRRGQVGVVHHLSATYKCTRAMWQYLLAFLRANAGRAFMAYEQINVSTLGDQIFTIKLTLVAKSRTIDIGQDEALIAIYNMTKDEQDSYFNQLEKLVNKDLPNTTRGLA